MPASTCRDFLTNLSRSGSNEIITPNNIAWNSLNVVTQLGGGLLLLMSQIRPAKLNYIWTIFRSGGGGDASQFLETFAPKDLLNLRVSFSYLPNKAKFNVKRRWLTRNIKSFFGMAAIILPFPQRYHCLFKLQSKRSTKSFTFWNSGHSKFSFEVWSFIRSFHK